MNFERLWNEKKLDEIKVVKNSKIIPAIQFTRGDNKVITDSEYKFESHHISTKVIFSDPSKISRLDIKREVI